MVCSPHSRRVRRFRAEVVLRSCQELEGRTGFLFYFSSWQLPVSSAVRCVAPEPTVGLSLVKDCSKIKHPCFSNVGGHFDRFVSQGSRVKRAEMQKQRFSSSFHERSRYLRAQGAEPHHGVVRIMPPTDLLREPGWHTQCYHGTSRDPGYSKVSCSVPASHRKQFGMKDEGRPRCLCRLQRFIGNSEAFLIAAQKRPPQPGARLHLRPGQPFWGLTPTPIPGRTGPTGCADGCGNARFLARGELQSGKGFAAGSGRRSAHLYAGGRGAPQLGALLPGAPRHREEQSREERAGGAVPCPRPAALSPHTPALRRRREPSRAAPSPGSSRSRSAAIAMSFLL